MKGEFYHRRTMSYLAMFGMILCASGVIFFDVKAGAIGAIMASFAAVVGTYMGSATYDDHSTRKNKHGNP
jgi:hypothetical protein